MVQDDLDTVSVEPTPGWTVTGPATWNPGNDLTEEHTFLFAWGPLRAQFVRSSLTAADSTWYIWPIFGLAFWPEQQSGGHLMRHRAVGLWAGFLMLGATALHGRRPARLGAGRRPRHPTDPPPSRPRSHPPRSDAGAPVLSPSSATPGSSKTGPSSTAFTGAELALLFTIGAVAIGVGGMLVLVSRRRRSSRRMREVGGRQ